MSRKRITKPIPIYGLQRFQNSGDEITLVLSASVMRCSTPFTVFGSIVFFCVNTCGYDSSEGADTGTLVVAPSSVVIGVENVMVLDKVLNVSVERDDSIDEVWLNVSLIFMLVLVGVVGEVLGIDTEEANSF